MAVLLAGVAYWGTGCSGINASQSVSPATFLLPGLLKADPPPATPPTDPSDPLPVAGSGIETAQAR